MDLCSLYIYLQKWQRYIGCLCEYVQCVIQYLQASVGSSSRVLSHVEEELRTQANYERCLSVKYEYKYMCVITAFNYPRCRCTQSSQVRSSTCLNTRAIKQVYGERLAEVISIALIYKLKHKFSMSKTDSTHCFFFNFYTVSICLVSFYQPFYIFFVVYNAADSPTHASKQTMFFRCMCV